MKFILVIFMFIMTGLMSQAAYMGTSYIGDSDSLRQDNLPYDTIKQNCIGINYMENLLDIRTNLNAYSHLGYTSSNGDSFNLAFPDDSARFLEGLALEADYSPIVRLEMARRIAKGIIASHINGSEGYYNFRIRHVGKEGMIADNGNADGYAVMSYYGDYVEPAVYISFETDQKFSDFKYTDVIKDSGHSILGIRAPENWNKSPYTWQRVFKYNNKSVTGSYNSYNSIERVPVSVKYTSKNYKNITTVLGKEKEPMPIFNYSGNTPGTVYLPDRKTIYRSDKDGNISIDRPQFNYIFLSKSPSWATVGYSAGVLIFWEKGAEKLEILADNGYGQVKITQKQGKKVSLEHYRWYNPDEMDYIFRNADLFEKTGSFIETEFLTPWMMNATYTGLAASSYMLTKWQDPFAPTALSHATRAVDRIFEEMEQDKYFLRAFFPVRAASWMIKTAKVLGDKEMEAKYTKDLNMAMERMIAYSNGTGWGGSWDHWNSVRALFMAYNATGDIKYKKLWEKALTEVTIDEKGLYIDGKLMEESGGINTYFGSMPIGAWGAAGWLDKCEMYMHLNVPAYKTKDSIMIRQLWNDAGAGPWAQDDANPEFVGYCLAGMNIPSDTKYVVPVGFFSSYDINGNVTLKNEPLIDNPFFAYGNEKPYIIKDGNIYNPNIISKKRLDVNKTIKNNKPLVFTFDVSDIGRGIAYDLDITGDGYQIDASPDGRNWYRKYDTKNMKERLTSVDLSNYVGTADEYIETLKIYSRDTKNIFLDRGTRLESGNRYIDKYIIYELNLKNMSSAFGELCAGNNVKIELSGDNKNWSLMPDNNYNKAQSGVWKRIIKFNDYIPFGKVYVKISVLDSKYSDKSYIQSLFVYSVFDVDKLYLKISNVWDTVPKSFSLKSITQRSW